MRIADFDGQAKRSPVWAGSLRWLAIVVAFLNLGIHVYLAPMHLEEKLYIGVLFLIGSATLGVVVVGLATDRDRVRTLAWLLGFAASAVMFIAFVLSRTIGLPGGYLEPWAESTEDILGLVSLGLELVFCGCCIASITTDRAVSRMASAPTLAHRVLPLHDRTAPLA